MDTYAARHMHLGARRPSDAAARRRVVVQRERAVEVARFDPVVMRSDTVQMRVAASVL